MDKLDCTYFTVEFYTSFNGIKGKVSFEVNESVEISFDYNDEDGSLRVNYNGEYLEFLDDISYEFGGTFAYIKATHQEQNLNFTKTKYQCIILSTMETFVNWTIQDIIIEIHKHHGLNYIVEEEE